jgi:predicted XRE-type DNA-binding protein
MSGGRIVKPSRRKRLEKAGWAVGDAAEFLGLSAQEAALVDMRLALARHLRTLRTRRKLSQATVARLVRSSQSRVAKMEAGDPTVSIDLLLRSLLTIGATKKEIARTIGGRRARRAA